jgi:hypothetical protein
MSLTSTYYNTLINFTTVTCFKYGKNSYFTLSCPELKDIINIKEIKEEKISNKLNKDSLLGYPIDLNKIDLSQLISGKYFMVPYTVS